MATDDTYSDVFAGWSIDDGIREVLKRMYATTVIRWSANNWKLYKEISNALELLQETVRQLRAAFLPVEAGGFKKASSAPRCRL